MIVPFYPVGSVYLNSQTPNWTQNSLTTPIFGTFLKSYLIRCHQICQCRTYQWNCVFAHQGPLFKHQRNGPRLCSVSLVMERPLVCLTSITQDSSRLRRILSASRCCGWICQPDTIEKSVADNWTKCRRSPGWHNLIELSCCNRSQIRRVFQIRSLSVSRTPVLVFRYLTVKLGGSARCRLAYRAQPASSQRQIPSVVCYLGCLSTGPGAPAAVCRCRAATGRWGVAAGSRLPPGSPGEACVCFPADAVWGGWRRRWRRRGWGGTGSRSRCEAAPGRKQPCRRNPTPAPGRGSRHWWRWAGRAGREGQGSQRGGRNQGKSTLQPKVQISNQKSLKIGHK